jgi:hypothetical protein
MAAKKKAKSTSSVTTTTPPAEAVAPIAATPIASGPDALDKALADDAELLLAARAIVAYAAHLFDDDEKLTKTGALAGDAKAQLRAKIAELVK